MLLIVCMLIGSFFFMLERIWELGKEVKKMEEIIKSMNHDLNMVSKTMENIHRHEKTKEPIKPIIKG